MLKSKFKEVDNFLNDANIRRLLISSAGENALAVIQALKEESEDEKIAEKLGLKVSDVRTVLNKLNEERFVYYNRIRDKKSGWYYYHWYIDVNKFKEWVMNKFFKKFERLMQSARNEELYYCPSCGIENTYSFEEAMDLSFKCPICNNSLDLLDEEKIKSFMPKIGITKKNTKKTKKKN